MRGPLFEQIASSIRRMPRGIPTTSGRSSAPAGRRSRPGRGTRAAARRFRAACPLRLTDQSDQTSALPQKGQTSLQHDTETVPSLGCFGAKPGGFLALAPRFGNRGRGGQETVRPPREAPPTTYAFDGAGN
jgi:hypothetical protein